MRVNKLNMNKEVFRAVPGYEGSYQVSDLGNIKSLPRKCRMDIRAYTTKERILKPGVDSHGYLYVILCNEGKRKIIRVHQLVAMAFLNHKPCGYNGLIVDHIDNDKLNNRLSNLQLISARYNTSKDRKGGTSKYTGVSWAKASNKWMSSIEINGKTKRIGSFKCELAAAAAYQKELIKLK